MLKKDVIHGERLAMGFRLTMAQGGEKKHSECDWVQKNILADGRLGLTGKKQTQRQYSAWLYYEKIVLIWTEKNRKHSI